MTEQKDIIAALADIQHQMRAPKNKTNTFGGYKYRNAEMILAAFKGLGIEGASLYCSDSLQEVAGHIFVTATARLSIGNQFIEAQGHAMHPLQKKGMDASQITGTASSYARKYALCGLFAIEDETQDPDSKDNREDEGKGANKDNKPEAPQARDPEKISAWLIDAIGKATTAEALGAWPAEGSKAEAAWAWLALEAPDHNERVKQAYAKRREELTEAPF
jgi:hypothetical protein